MTNPQVSIIVPVYNAKKYIDRCIGCVLSQSFSDWELIIVDDGSTDESNEIINNYSNKDERINLIQQSNQGAMAARKKGVEHANGHFIAFIDSDDEISPNYLSSLVEMIGDTDCVASNATWIKRNGDKLNLKGDITAGIYSGEKQMQYVISNMLVFNNQTYHYGILPYLWSKLFRADLAKEIFEEVSLNIEFGDDQDFVWRYILRSESISVTDASYYIYYQNEESITNKKNEFYIRDLGQLYGSLYALFSNHKYASVLLMQLEMYIMSRMSWVPLMMPWSNPDILEEWGISLFSEIPGNKVVIYGAGKIGKSLYKQFKFNPYYRVVAWLDRDFKKYEQNEVVQNPENIVDMEFDCVIVGVGEGYKNEVIDWLYSIGIPHNKVVWKKWTKKMILPY
ncbi:glycosyltransferase [Pseudobutyrivibrio sp. MD2005]|uniref:glycosyltransferase n=1 Tax=Pseudobutyrivibrio sp. MD2005 TaxID=1410616 RepID=UPI000487CD64|nr:glycosyltransferase [Pseudobutyrivibrio sp. MD2005]